MEKIEKKKMSASLKMFLGMVLGLIAGFVIGEPITVIKPFGTIFINLLKMTMVPLVFVSITLSVAGLNDIRSLGRIGGKTFGFYVLTTALASTIAIIYSTIIQPGVGYDIGQTIEVTATPASASTLMDTFMSIVPTNIVQSMAEAHLLSIIFFSIMFGIALVLIGDKKKPVYDFLESFQEAIIKIVHIVLLYAPFGVFALMSSVTGQYGFDAISSLGKFLLTEYLGFSTMILVVYGISLAMCKLNLFTFLSRGKDAMLSAATTLSSAATVPVELRICETHLGVPKEIGGFAFPLGATVNQNGTALNITCCVLFSAQVYGFDLSIVELVTLITLAVTSAIGASAVPASGSVFTLMILTQFGIPTEAFGIIIASYTLVDIGSTTMNITGDMVGAIVVSHTEKRLNRKVWEKSYVPPRS